MKIFSKHRRKLEAHRRYGSREFKEKLNTAKNYKRLGFSAQKGFINLFSKTGLSQIGTFFAIAAIGTIFYFLTVSPYFRVTEVSVSGNNQVASATIQDQVKSLGAKRFLLVPQNSLFLLNQKKISAEFAKNIPEISEVKVRRRWPNKISLEVTERNPVAVVADDYKYFLVDDQGFVIKTVDDPGNEFQIIDQVNEDIQVGETISGRIIPFVISVRKLWPAKITVPLASAKIPGKGAGEVELVSAEGWSTFFSTDRPAANQLQSLALLTNQLLRPASRVNLAYIDLRLADRAYYCMKSSPCQQTQIPETAAASVDSYTTPQNTNTLNSTKTNDTRN